MLITHELARAIEEASTGEVFIAYYTWLLQRGHNVGYNVLLHEEGARWGDEMPLVSQVGQDVPECCGCVVLALSCDTGDCYAALKPGRLLGLAQTVEEAEALLKND